MNIQEQTDVVHQKVYDFLLYLYPLLSKYPKYEKFSLQTTTRNAVLEILMELVKWDKTATKSHLYAADSALQQAKELIRLANDLKYSAMNKQHYGVSCGKLAEIGVMLGVLIEDVKTGSGGKGK
ncbi:MAG: diversity-generating retroelement protein Avd [Acetatifactor sp.]|nr:diversity-generating retroelement protein Avd [Acetatifactor sp.]